ncbi:MAG: VWA domain-containing protein [Bryobacteraceae bacterium]|nr:VWA domain-containing protein [Bryobacteraceae bacterium]
MRRIALFFVIASLLAQEVPTISVDVRLVRVACTVTRSNGQLVTGLTQQDFRLNDRGVPQSVTYFWRENDQPLTVGLVVDISGSQMRNLAKHRATLGQFLKQVLRPGDRAFLVTVAANVRLLRDFTDQADLLASDIDYRLRDRGQPLGPGCVLPGLRADGRPRTCGGSIIWNAVYAAAEKLQDVPGRKALLLLTDGVDSGSNHRLDDAIQAAQEAETAVYAIGVKGEQGSIGFGGPIRVSRTSLNKDLLQNLAGDTGGIAFLDNRSPEKIFGQIEAELRGLYLLGYTPRGVACDGEFHALAVSAGGNLRVRSRKGYYCRP